MPALCLRCWIPRSFIPSEQATAAQLSQLFVLILHHCTDLGRTIIISETSCACALHDVCFDNDEQASLEQLPAPEQHAETLAPAPLLEVPTQPPERSSLHAHSTCI